MDTCSGLNSKGNVNKKIITPSHERGTGNFDRKKKKKKCMIALKRPTVEKKICNSINWLQQISKKALLVA